jgi:hypothetical protein
LRPSSRILARDELALFFAVDAAPDEVGEALGDEAGREEGAAFVGVDIVAQRGDDVGYGPRRDRVQLVSCKTSVRLVNSLTRTAKSHRTTRGTSRRSSGAAG